MAPGTPDHVSPPKCWPGLPSTLWPSQPFSLNHLCLGGNWSLKCVQFGLFFFLRKLPSNLVWAWYLVLWPLDTLNLTALPRGSL